MSTFNKHFFAQAGGLQPVCDGNLLLSNPFLTEKWFCHSAIFMLHAPDELGAMGLVLNKQIDCTLKDVETICPSTREVPLYCGGPVAQDELHFIHTLGPDIIDGAEEIIPGVFVDGCYSDAIDYVNQGFETEGFIRFFVGYSGWEAGQLQKELANNTWAVTAVEANAQLLTGHGDEYWHRIVRRMGYDYRTWRLVPQNPSNN